MIHTDVYTIGTAATTIVAFDPDTAKVWVENLEPSNELGDFSRNGNVYTVSQDIAIANGGTAIFSFTTGANGAQFDFWNFTAKNSSVLGELIEGATITTTGTVIPAYNLNRNESDTYQSVLESATALTGGTTVLTEYIVASNQSGGGADSSKIVTLAPNTEYGFKFVDVGGNGAPLHIQLGFVEEYNGLNDVFINGATDSTVRIRGGQQVQLHLGQGESLTAVAKREGVSIAVFRQD